MKTRTLCGETTYEDNVAKIYVISSMGTIPCALRIKCLQENQPFLELVDLDKPLNGNDSLVTQHLPMFTSPWYFSWRHLMKTCTLCGETTYEDNVDVLYKV